MTTLSGSNAFTIASFAIVVGAAYYGVLVYVVWKFYQMLSKINENSGLPKLRSASYAHCRGTLSFLSGAGSVVSSNLRRVGNA
jgi:hypothetical protein